MAKSTLSQEGYRYIRYSHEYKGHILKDLSMNKYELFYANKGHASWGMKWRNTDLEFARSLTKAEANANG